MCSLSPEPQSQSRAESLPSVSVLTLAAGPWGQLKLVNSPLRGAWLDFQPLKPKILASSLPPPLSLPHAPHLIQQELP